MGDLQRLIQNQEKNSNSENLGQHLLFNNPLSYKSIQTSIQMPAKKKSIFSLKPTVVIPGKERVPEGILSCESVGRVIPKKTLQKVNKISGRMIHMLHN